jgi:hypothetical protein
MKRHKFCRICRVPITSMKGRPPTFCSAACRQKAYRRRQAPSELRRRLAAMDAKDAAHTSAVRLHTRAIEQLGFKVTLQRLVPLKESQLNRIFKRDPGVAKLLQELRWEEQSK